MVLVGAVLGLAAPASALKGKPDDAQGREKAAKKACSVGDFQKGVDILGDLFVESGDVTYVYNQGRCYQQNSQWEPAISRFREYLRKAKQLSDADRAEVDQQIADCEASLARLAHVTPAPVAAPPPVAPAAAQPVVHEPPPVLPEASTATPSLVRDPGKGLRTAGIVCGVAGLVALGTGVGLALKTQQISSDAKAAGGATPSQADERKTLVTWGWVSYGVGAAALTTGVVLYLVGRSAGQSSKLALVPEVGSNGGSVWLKGAF